MKQGLQKFLVTLLVIFSVSLSAFAQNGVVKGTVIDDQNEPLIGATVIEPTTSKAVLTDIDGHYEINVGDVKNPSLLFKMVGMDDMTVEVKGRNVIDLTMTSSLTELDAVVAIGYGAARKKELTGAVANVTAKDIAKVNTSDLGSALQGQVAGVNIVAADGAPGSGSEILIRGVSSISGQNTPLYVVDGVPQSGDPRIAPSEIESIDILKDAASAAIYGTRGAAGVILITTKQGKEGSLKITADASYGIQNITSKNNLMDAYEQTYFDIVFARNLKSELDDETLLDLARNPDNFFNNTDLSEYVFVDNAPVQNYSVNISGGTKNLTYNVSAGYYNKEGIVINSGFERFNSRINTRYKKDRWEVTASVDFQTEDIEKASGGLISQSLRYFPYQDAPDFSNDDTLESTGGESGNRMNWVLTSFKSTNTQESLRANGNFGISYEILDCLKFNGRAGIGNNYQYLHSFVPYQEVINVTNGDVISRPEDSSVTMTSRKYESMVLEGGFTFQKAFGKHNLTAYLGASSEKFGFEGFVASKAGILDNSITNLNGASINPGASSESGYINTLVGTIGRVQYNWDSRYMLSVSARYDGSSKFSKDNRWGFFPSISGAWNVSSESWFKNWKTPINNFKLRASYGTTGNQNFGAYAYAAAISTGMDGAFNGALVPGSTQTNFANANVKWETTKQVNFGIDLGFFRNKFTLTAEYYMSNKEDMLFPVTLPLSSGAGGSSVIMNVGNMKNSGFELALGYRDQVDNVSWYVNGTLGTNDNVITEMMSDKPIAMNDLGLVSGSTDYSRVTYLAEGYEAGAFFIYTTDGIANTEERLAEYQKLEATAKMGDLIYKDNNGDGKISDDDRVYVGSGMPKIECGLNYGVEFHGVDISMSWYGAFGHQIMNGSDAVSYAYGRNKDLLDCWSEANPLGKLPSYRGIDKQHANYRGYTDLWLEDGDYLRLKQVTVGYSINPDALKTVGINSLRLYVSAQNALTFTKYTGYDPEIGGSIASRGLDKANYPVSAFYMVGLNLGF